MAGQNSTKRLAGAAGVTPAFQSPNGVELARPNTNYLSLNPYDTPSPSQKTIEGLMKTSAQGNADQFTKMTPQVGIVDGKATDAGTGAEIATLKDKMPQQPSGGGGGKPALVTNDLKVTLSQEPAADELGGGTVVFEVMPTIQEERSVTYQPMDIVHHPGEIMKYKSTSARSWQISAKLISRDQKEAAANLKTINLIRAWAMPYHGIGTEATDARLLGAPPPILTLAAYGNTMIGPVKCVLESHSWTWPNDVDYIPTDDSEGGERVPFPVLLDISISLKEAWSPAEYSGFSIRDYRAGKLPKAFTSIADKSKQQQPQASDSRPRGGQ